MIAINALVGMSARLLTASYNCSGLWRRPLSVIFGEVCWLRTVFSEVFSRLNHEEFYRDS